MFASTDRLHRHLEAWLGDWPPMPGRLVVVGSDCRDRVGWDEQMHPVIAVLSPMGGVVSVSSPAVGEVRKRLADVDYTDAAGIAKRLDGAWGLFRFSTAPTVTVDVGEWVPTDDPRVPEWLQPFNDEVLIVWDEDGRYGAGVGRKKHDAWGHELSVGTDPSLQGQGMGRLLVATAARQVLADGAVPTYLHVPTNYASAKVADAAGFPDLGWRFVSASH